jgi:hypothetical protein
VAVDLVQLGPGQPPLPASHGAIGPDFAVAGGLRLLAGHRVVSPPSGRGALARPSTLGTSRFAPQASGALLLVSGRWLGVVEDGAFASRVELWEEGQQVAGGAAGAVYVASAPASKGPGSLYLLTPEGQAKLFEHPTAIRCLSADPDGVLVGVTGGALALSDGARPEVVLSVDGLQPVGVARPPGSPLAFVSSEDQVLAVRDGVGLPVLTGLGGPLRWSVEDRALYVLDRDRRLLLRLGGLEDLGA